MPSKAKTDVSDTATADTAVAEIIDSKESVSVEFAGAVFTFKRKRINSVQFRVQMQKYRDAAAIEWLLGASQFARFLAATEDEDGCTPEDTYLDFVAAIGAAVGAGNS